MIQRILAIFFVATVTLQAEAISFKPGDDASIKEAASIIANNLLSYYSEASPYVLPSPYYWWEAGSVWSSLIEYWHYTGDDSYNDVVTQALTSQASVTNDFMQPQCEGNDDQGWWALAAMSAAEYDLPSPAGAPSWFSRADKVFQEFTSRWDTRSCKGGLKWKISPSAPGYNYKSSISNGVFFQLSARLARYTGDASYADWAERVFEWMQSVGLIDKNYNVFDGTDDSKGCIDVDHDQWSYNVGTFLYGSAIMQDHTGDAKWSTRTLGLLAATSSFFQEGIMYEAKCEPDGSCNVDQLSFKAILSRGLAGTAVVVPSTNEHISPLLSASASGAAASCAGGSNKQACGSRWYVDKFDGSEGVGQQLSALEVIHGLLYEGVSAPKTHRRRVLKFRA